MLIKVNQMSRPSHTDTSILFLISFSGFYSLSPSAELSVSSPFIKFYFFYLFLKSLPAFINFYFLPGNSQTNQDAGSTSLRIKEETTSVR